jgi:uncharacterized protein
MKRVFADTLYWVARTLSGDPWFAPTVRAVAALGPAQFVTTQEVLVEVLSIGAARGGYHRPPALQTVRASLEARNVTVVPQSEASFLAGLELYGNRADKDYSLVDCISMQTMRQMGIQEVLTNDHHFTQEGFTILIV